MIHVDITAELWAKLQDVKGISLVLHNLLLAGAPNSGVSAMAQRLIRACVVLARVVEPRTESPVASATPALADRIAALAADGVGVRQIARAVNLNPSNVSRRLRAMRNSRATPAK